MEIFMLSGYQIAVKSGDLRPLLVKQYQLLPVFVIVMFSLGGKMVICMSLGLKVRPHCQ